MLDAKLSDKARLTVGRTELRFEPERHEIQWPLSPHERFGDILQTRRPDSFFEWALTPDPQTGNLSPLLMYLYRLRRDVSAAYPDVLGKDREGFLTWARTSGAREMGYEPAEIRIAGAAAG